MFEVKSGAVFVADAHANVNKQEFKNWLLFVSKNHPNFSQIFFMGDMFDFLANTTYTQKFYAYEISLINELSKIYEIYYFEGNHDFNLTEIFPNVKVFSIKNQPAIFSSEVGDISLSHGDKFIPFFSGVFIRFLRNKPFLKFMDTIDKAMNFKISKLILKSQEDKTLYKKHPNFKSLIGKKISKYSTKFIIEGHYHQDEILEFNQKKYINLNSFAVNPKVYIVKFLNDTVMFTKFKGDM
ncbi:metallophosphoesterase [Campylobacter corcagiensis]|uniref:metallophosphoesterase n=1 Tax=Campylobacter corcagiensis TaxID=1448857 RepID=UPI0004B5D812|nr:metallophosphoesterase [Campylobacter corcagiensis]QKF64072.1 YbbF/LpxH family metallophosphatase [Campylobacter corcagiensis]